MQIRSVNTVTGLQIKLKQLVENAIRNFNDSEEYLISRDLSERCICSKFAMYLDKAVQRSEFGDYHVDVEYNRGAEGSEYNPKSLENKKIVVDLIVHKRGYDINYGFDNLICIEMKKSGNKDIEKDEERLETMTRTTSGFYYKIGLMLVVDMKQHSLRIHKEFHDS